MKMSEAPPPCTPMFKVGDGTCGRMFEGDASAEEISQVRRRSQASTLNMGVPGGLSSGWVAQLQDCSHSTCEGRSKLRKCPV